MTITDQQLDQASKNLEANPLIRAHVKLEKLLWGPAAAPLAMRTDVVVGADLVRSAIPTTRFHLRHRSALNHCRF